jgi:hypothetical protein
VSTTTSTSDSTHPIAAPAARPPTASVAQLVGRDVAVRGQLDRADVQMRVSVRPDMGALFAADEHDRRAGQHDQRDGLAEHGERIVA